MTIINKNIIDLYNLIINPIYIKKIYKPIEVNNDVIINKYDIFKYDDIPNELKLILNSYVVINTIQKIDIDDKNNIITINHQSKLVNDIPEFNDILNSFIFKFDIIFNKYDEISSSLDFKFYDMNENNININPLHMIIYMLFNNYINDVLIPNIKSKYIIKLNNYISSISI